MKDQNREIPVGDEDAGTRVDPLELIWALEGSDRFERDSPLGGLFHHGKISFRELCARDSMHIIIDRDGVTAHVDPVCPLDDDPDSPGQYSPLGVLAHNLTGMAADVAGVLTGRKAEHRCNLHGELVEVADNVLQELVAEPAQHDGQRGRVVDQPTCIPFSLVDQAVWLLDTEAAPWSVQLEIRTAGTFDEARLREALIQALKFHPMARVRKVPSRPWRAHNDWEITPAPELDPLRVVECPDDAALVVTRAELQSRLVPLNESPPLRARLARHPDGDVLMLNVNHGVMDGFGALQVLRSVGRAYTGEPEPTPRLDFFQAREFPVRLVGAGAEVKVRRNLALLEKLRDLVVAPARLAADGAGTEAGYGFHHVRVSADVTRALSRLEHRGTDTDVLLATLHVAIARWNKEHGKGSGRISVLVPSDLRPPKWRDDMVGNFTLPTRVSTTRRSRRSRRAALEAVTRQTARKKEVGMGTALIELLGRTRLFPLWAKRALVELLPLTGNRLVDTAMVSNLGDVSDPPSFGDAGETVEMWFSPPARMPLGLTVGALTLGGRLHLAFRYRHRLFGHDAARRFADDYVAELKALVGDAATGG